MPTVAVIMGSDSDLLTMKDACNILNKFNIDFELTIVSAHRTPDRMYEYAKNAHNNNIKVIIAGAGGAAHLPGMVASLTAIPVIGVPVKSNAMSGLDSLYSICQMPKGIPVATVAIGNSYNAGLLAIRMLAINNKELFDKINNYMIEQSNGVIEKVNNWNNILTNNTDEEINKLIGI